jgi:Segregation and condensation protein ScpA
LVANVYERLEVIVRFLAVLELFKQGHVDIEQPENFGTLLVQRLEHTGALDAASLSEWEDDTELGDEPPMPAADHDVTYAEPERESESEEEDDASWEPVDR